MFIDIREMDVYVCVRVHVWTGYESTYFCYRNTIHYVVITEGAEGNM